MGIEAIGATYVLLLLFHQTIRTTMVQGQLIDVLFKIDERGGFIAVWPRLSGHFPRSRCFLNDLLRCTSIPSQLFKSTVLNHVCTWAAQSSQVVEENMLHFGISMHLDDISLCVVTIEKSAKRISTGISRSRPS